MQKPFIALIPLASLAIGILGTVVYYRNFPQERTVSLATLEAEFVELGATIRGCFLAPSTPEELAQTSVTFRGTGLNNYTVDCPEPANNE